jgi:hypothetical protein
MLASRPKHQRATRVCHADACRKVAVDGQRVYWANQGGIGGAPPARARLGGRTWTGRASTRTSSPARATRVRWRSTEWTRRSAPAAGRRSCAGSRAPGATSSRISSPTQGRPGRGLGQVQRRATSRRCHRISPRGSQRTSSSASPEEDGWRRRGRLDPQAEAAGAQPGGAGSRARGEAPRSRAS